MPSQNSGIPSPYSLGGGTSDALGNPNVDSNTGIPLASTAAPALPSSSFVLNAPASAGGNYSPTSTGLLSAILCELRVISSLLNMNSQNAVLSSMRAVEISGSTGGALN